MTPRDKAKANQKATYHGAKCGWDGTTLRSTLSGLCMACLHYKKAIRAGLIDGIDGRKEIKRVFKGSDFS